jgi:hypothetical protein
MGNHLRPVPKTLRSVVLSLPHAGLSVTQTAYEVGAAVRWLCPEQTWQIKELHDAEPTQPRDLDSPV